MKQLLFLGCLLLSACRLQSPLPLLPEGVQTLTGTIVPTTMSTSRRGTHLLRQSGSDQAYLESSTVLLREFQGRTTAMRGHFERNIDVRDLPVFVVESVVSSDETFRSWSSAALGMDANIPTRWGVSATQNDGVMFIPAGSLSPLVGITRFSESPLPSGIALSIDGGRAIRFLDDISGEQRIAVEQTSGYLELSFTPQHEPDLVAARAEWMAFLRSVKVKGIAPASSSSRTSASDGSPVRDRTPCGGVAGILCPSGQYCEITDLDQNVGICRSMD